jgi:hypothetical protein
MAIQSQNDHLDLTDTQFTQSHFPRFQAFIPKSSVHRYTGVCSCSCTLCGVVVDVDFVRRPCPAVPCKLLHDAMYMPRSTNREREPGLPVVWDVGMVPMMIIFVSFFPFFYLFSPTACGA